MTKRSQKTSAEMLARPEAAITRNRIRAALKAWKLRRREQAQRKRRAEYLEETGRPPDGGNGAA